MRRSRKKNGDIPRESHGGKGINACQQNRQVTEQLALIIKTLQQLKGDCVIQNHMSVSGNINSGENHSEQFLSLEAELREFRATIREFLGSVKSPSQYRLGEGFLKEFVRIMGRVSGLPVGPKTRTKDEIVALTEEMGGVLEDNGFTPIVPAKGDLFDPDLHLPIEVKGNGNGGGKRLVERVFRPGVKASNGRMVLHARVGLSVESVPRDKEKK